MDENLRATLEENNLSDCIPIFEEQHLLHADDLSELTEDDYRKIGITKLGDLKRLTKLFSGNTSKNEAEQSTQTVPEVVSQEFGKAEWDWCKSSLGGRHLLYRYGNSEEKYCPSCYLKITSDSFVCPNCHADFKEEVSASATSSDTSSTANASAAATSSVVVNNFIDSDESNTDSAFSKSFHNTFGGITGGVLGAIIGSVLVVVILLIVLSNETIRL